MTVGRNDHCPCGSGKKYKKCCLDKDRSRAGVSPESHLRSAINAFIEEVDPRHELKEAALMDWFGSRPDSMDKQDLVDLMDYFIHDRPLPGETVPLLETFYERKWEALPEDELRILKDWLGNRRAFVEVMQVRPGEGLAVKDLFTGADYDLKDISLSRAMAVWDLLWIRLLPQKGLWLVTGSGVGIPRRLKEDLLKGMKELFREFAGENPGKSLDDLMRTEPENVRHWIREVLFDRPDPTILTGTGELLTPIDAELELTDPEAFSTAIRKMKDFDPVEGPEEEGRGFKWMRRGPSARMFPVERMVEGRKFKSFTIGAHDGEIVLGTLGVNGSRVKLSCFSQERMDRLISLIERRLPGQTRFVGSKRTPLAAISPKGDAPAQERLPPEIEREFMGKYYEDYYTRWLDMEIPALEGMTPRKAVKSRKMKPALIELLKDFENSEAIQKRRGEPVYGVEKIRKALGLD
jgi:hypothetical protein